MKSFFKMILSCFKMFWRTVVRTVVRKQDVDQDGKEEIILDFNGVPDHNMNEVNESKEEV